MIINTKSTEIKESISALWLTAYLLDDYYILSICQKIISGKREPVQLLLMTPNMQNKDSKG